MKVLVTGAAGFVGRHVVARLLEHPRCDEVVNICSGEPISVRRLVERHLAHRGASIRLNLSHYPYSSEEPMAFWGDATRMAAILQKS